jgi:Zn-dependent protease with chaperone function
LEQAGVLGQKYLLWVSVGAQKGLLTDEMEALLWHECGHVALLKRLWWRELAALLTPWAPRFLDLAEDPYEDERRADSLAVQRMGSPEPLLSVLRKLKEQQRLRDGTGYRRARPGGWRLLCWADEVWEERWVGYLHPDVEQRLRWLQAMRGEGDA